jgi:hypothetical protein
MEQNKKTTLIICLVLGVGALCVICVVGVLFVVFTGIGESMFEGARIEQDQQQQSAEQPSGDATQHNGSSSSPRGLSSSLQRAKDALIETSRKMDGDFVIVMIDIVQSAETGGTPMSICDQRAYAGHFSLETLVAYQKWRSAMLADTNGDVRQNFPRSDTNSTD